MNSGRRDTEIRLHLGLGRRPPVDLAVVIDERDVLPLPRCARRLQSEFPFECLVEGGGEQGVKLGGSLSLQPAQRIDLSLQDVQLHHDSGLFRERWKRKIQRSNIRWIEAGPSLPIPLSYQCVGESRRNLAQPLGHTVGVPITQGTCLIPAGFPRADRITPRLLRRPPGRATAAPAKRPG